AGNVIAFSDPFVRHRARVRPMRILVADDQSANLMVLRRVLEKAGHRPQVVDDGEDVLVALESQSFDAVIIDLHMPGASGLEVLKQARFMEAGKRRTPVIMLTADATPEARAECERAGAFAYMTKPMVVDRLLEQLAAIADGEAASRAPRAPAAPEPAPADGSVISQHILEELRDMGLGEEFVHRFLGECARDARKCLADLEAAGGAGEWDAFRDACHALKGAAGNMGAVRLSDAASQGMRMGTDTLAREWGAMVRTLRQQLEQALAALRARGDLARGDAAAGPDSACARGVASAASAGAGLDVRALQLGAHEALHHAQLAVAELERGVHPDPGDLHQLVVAHRVHGVADAVQREAGGGDAAVLADHLVDGAVALAGLDQHVDDPHLVQLLGRVHHAIEHHRLGAPGPDAPREQGVGAHAREQAEQDLR